MVQRSKIHPSRMAPTKASSMHLEGWQLYIVIASLFFGTFLIALDTNILNVAVPKISTDFHALDNVAWYGTSYLVTLTAFQPIYGSLYKFFPTTIVYRLAIIVFEGDCSQFNYLRVVRYTF